MLRQESMSAKMAKITNKIDTDNAGYVTEEGLNHIMRGFGVVRQAANYKTKMTEYGYIYYDRMVGGYYTTKESRTSATITITVKPSLYAEEVRRHLVETLAGYPDLIEISDVSL